MVDAIWERLGFIGRDKETFAVHFHNGTPSVQLLRKSWGKALLSAENFSRFVFLYCIILDFYCSLKEFLFNWSAPALFLWICGNLERNSLISCLQNPCNHCLKRMRVWVQTFLPFLFSHLGTRLIVLILLNLLVLRLIYLQDVAINKYN